VLQNHLTEVMTLLLMNLPANSSNSEEILQNKLHFLASLQHIDNSNAVVGQYQAYNGEVQEELNKTKDYFSLTPTFAGEWKSFLVSACNMQIYPCLSAHVRYFSYLTHMHTHDDAACVFT